MVEPIACAEHGETRATFVCRHIAQSLNEREARGFFWSIDEEEEYQARCSMCEQASIDLSEEDWAAYCENSLVVTICMGCFRVAADLNDVSLDGAT